MTITIHLQPEVEKSLLTQAGTAGVSPAELVEQIVLRELQLAETPSVRTGRDLIESSAGVRGLLTDEEIDRLFARNASAGRPVDLS